MARPKTAAEPNTDGDSNPRMPTSAALGVVALIWIGSAFLFAQHAAPWLPRFIAAQLSLHSFLIAVLLVATALGLGLARVVLPTPRQTLGVRTAPLHLFALAAFVAPMVVAGSLYLGFDLALDTLIAEIRAGGARAAQANTGDFGRALAKTHIATTLVWAVLLTPIVEELMFRGALWGAVERAILPKEVTAIPSLSDRHTPSRGDGRAFIAGAAATAVSTAVFVWLHADQQGGAGIVRVVQVSALGLALGALRHGSASVGPPIVLHALFNLAGIAKARRWLPSEMWPPPLPIPWIFWQLAAVGALLTLLWFFHRLPSAKRSIAKATIFISQPCEPVYRFVIDPDSIPLGFKGHGAIPASTQAELVDGEMRVGAKRRVHNADGSVVEEVIVGLEAPHHQAYELVSGLRPPFSWLVSGGRGEWTLEPEGDGTRVAWTFHWHLRSGLLWLAVRPLAQQFARAMRLCLENQRDHLERTGDTS